MRSVHVVARVVGVAVLLVAAVEPATAQLLRPAAATGVQESSAPPSAARSFAIEAAGGVTGSLLGFGVVYLAQDRCDVEDLACTIQSAFGGIALGTVASAAGTYLAGRAADTDPSLLGASLGAIAGAGVGVGLWHLFTQELDIGNKPVIAIVSYSVAQGVTSALGSRLFHRDR